MARSKSSSSSDEGWDLEGALASLRAGMDPHIWAQGQELYRRGATEDFSVQADGAIQVRVRDPRDARLFFVEVKKLFSGRIGAKCPCPYRLGEYCRHQVVALEYLRAAAAGEIVALEGAGSPAAPSGAATVAASGPVLYRLFPPAAACGQTGAGAPADGSLLRVVLHALGSSRSPHRVGLQLLAESGWIELRDPEPRRWISRGGLGPHPRDALIASVLSGEDGLRSAVDSDTFARVLTATQGSSALVDRQGRPITVSPWPWVLAAKLARPAPGGPAVAVRVELSCRSHDSRNVPFSEVAVVPALNPWIQLSSGEFHPLVAGAPGPLIEELWEADLAEFSGGDLERLLAEGIGMLERLCPGAFETEEDLIHEVEGVDGARVVVEGTPERLRGRLELAYSGEWVEAPSTPEPRTVRIGERILRFPPAGQALARARRELEAIGFRGEGGVWTLEGPAALARLLAPRERRFVSLKLPASIETLDAVHNVPSLSLRVRPAADVHGIASFAAATGGRGETRGHGESAGAPQGDFGGGTGGARARSGIDWFEVDASLSVAGREIPIDLRLLEEAARRDPRGSVVLADGTVLGLEHESVRTVLALRSQSAAAQAGGASSFRAPLRVVGELIEERPGRRVDFDAALGALVQSLRAGAEAPAAIADERLDALLRPYQKAALRWFAALARWGLSGILADEMGLGKTLMLLTHLFARQPRTGEGAAAGAQSALGPVLVVCPTSLVFNWLDECRRFFPSLRAAGLAGEPQERRRELVQGDAELLVTSYALLRRDRELLESRPFRALVLDEGQHIKNPESQTAQAACALTARERWVLTGTPVENHLGELWSLFEFLMPGFLGARAEFQREFAEPIRRGEEEELARLRRRLRPFILRRTKAEVLSDLPPRIEQVERAPMTPEQAALYQRYLLDARAELEGEDNTATRFRVLAALTRLRQICCHPRLLERKGPRAAALEGAAAEERGEPSEGPTAGKFELLVELLEECVEEGHRVLLFSQFTSMLDLIEERLEVMGLRRCRLDGSTRDREAVVRRFAEDAAIPVFLISLKAGGFGLNLTQADTVILYDPWWNPAVEDQAAARAHRLGQRLPVHVHKLVTAGSVEEKILALQAEKQSLADGILRSDEDAARDLNLNDLKRLLYE
jgi:superfamily II DNA or RNA helicase